MERTVKNAGAAVSIAIVVALGSTSPPASAGTGSLSQRAKDLVQRVEANGENKVTRDEYDEVIGLDFTGEGEWGKSVELDDDDWSALEELTSLESLNLGMTKTEDRHLHHLRYLSELRDLNLGGTRVTGGIMKPTARGIENTDSLEPLASLTRLESLYLINGSFTGQGLEHLARLKNLVSFSATINSSLLYDTASAKPLQWLSLLTGLTDVSLRGNLVHVAGLEYLGHLKQLRTLSLHGEGITDEHLRFMGWLRAIEDVSVSGKVDGSFLVVLGDKPELRRISIRRCSLTSDGLSNLRSLEALQELHLTMCRIPGNFFGQLKELKALTSLNLLMTTVSPNGIEHLASLDQLTHLWIAEGFADEHLAHLAGSTQLEVLHIGSGITDAGVQHLAKMTCLEELGLSSNEGVTDASVEALARIQTLKKIWTMGTSISGEGNALLAKKIPGVQVRSSLFDD